MPHSISATDHVHPRDHWELLEQEEAQPWTCLFPKDTVVWKACFAEPSEPFLISLGISVEVGGEKMKGIASFFKTKGKLYLFKLWGSEGRGSQGSWRK
jgi:hypothetical protein